MSRQWAPGRVRVLNASPAPGCVAGQPALGFVAGQPALGFVAGQPALGFVVGLAAEARIAARFGYAVQAGGGTPEGAARAASQLVRQGATALVSFGLAGGLDPGLRPGMLIVPSAVRSGDDLLSADAALARRFGGLTSHTILAGSHIVSDIKSKRCLHTETKAHAIDLESGPVARVATAHGLPFIVVRAICDPAERNLPPAALVALDSKGGIGFQDVLRSVLRQPGQIPDLLALARDAAKARRTLIRLAERFQAEARLSSR